MSMATISLAASTLKPSAFTRLPLHSRREPITFRPLPSKPRPFAGQFRRERLGLFGFGKSGLEFCVNAQNGKGEKVGNDPVAEDDSTLAGGDSTMPERFRYLMKEAPDPPVRWPWFVALGLAIYTWRALLFELGNWTKLPLSVLRFLGDGVKLLFTTIFAMILHIIAHPVTFLITLLETGLYTVRTFYSGILNYTSIPAFATMIILSSAVLAIGEAAVPNSVSSQRYLLTFSGLIGYAAVASYISEPLFWTVLLGVYAFSRLVRKRDEVTSALPAAAVFTAIGEPWVRVLVMGSYIGLAVYHHSRNRSSMEEEEGEVQPSAGGNQVPVPLLCAAMAVGIKVAAKWAGHRHLTWMVV